MPRCIRVGRRGAKRFSTICRRASLFSFVTFSSLCEHTLLSTLSNSTRLSPHRAGRTVTSARCEPWQIFATHDRVERAKARRVADDATRRDAGGNESQCEGDPRKDPAPTRRTCVQLGDLSPGINCHAFPRHIHSPSVLLQDDLLLIRSDAPTQVYKYLGRVTPLSQRRQNDVRPRDCRGAGDSLPCLSRC